MNTTRDFSLYRNQEHCSDYTERNAKVTLGESLYLANVNHQELRYSCHVGYYNKAGPNNGTLDCVHLTNGKIRILGRKPICSLDVESIGVGIGVGVTLSTIIIVLLCLFIKQRKLNQILRRNISDSRSNTDKERKCSSPYLEVENIPMPIELAPLPIYDPATLRRETHNPYTIGNETVKKQTGSLQRSNRRISTYRPRALEIVNTLQHMEKETEFYDNNTSSKSSEQRITSAYPRMQGRTPQDDNFNGKAKAADLSLDFNDFRTSHFYDNPDEMWSEQASSEDEGTLAAAYYSRTPDERKTASFSTFKDITPEISTPATYYSSPPLELNSSKQPSTRGVQPTYYSSPDEGQSAGNVKDKRPPSRTSNDDSAAYYSQPPQEKQPVFTVPIELEIHV